jgi:osmotically-inducible protein OsmY
MKTDSMLQQDVIAELLYEPGLDASNIGVVANGGVITLTGTVPSYPGRYAAEHAAERVAGVRAVADETKVDLPSLHKRSDQDIAAAALNAMSWQVRVPSGAIQVRVDNGWVTLDGSVDFNFERQAAENAVRHLTGVIAVNNLITLKAAVSASGLKKDIESAFGRAAQVNASHIGLKVTGNKVVMSGNVSSWAERREAEHAAWSAPGVWQVENNLQVAI